MRPDPLDAVRAEGRRLREACESPANSDPTWITATDVFGKWVWENLDALLADPAPEGPIAPLVMLQQVREAMEEGGFTPTTDNGYIGTLIDIRKLAEAAADPAPEGLSEDEREFVRMARPPVPEGVPEDHRVCSHGIYHHGCPSCDRQDPEERL